MRDIKKRVVISMFIFIFFPFLLFYEQGIGQDLHCLPCHQNVINQETRYTHVPFSQYNCSVCHLSSEAPPPDDKDHENRLRTIDEIGIDICYKCHPREKLGVSHPVGVYATEKIRIPEELPTGTDERLLCITCHYPHGSDEEYRGREPVSAQLCIACHGRSYYE